ncbi:MAG: DUF5060 domain-containing protein, partial [Lentisphaerae bacterium]
MKSCYFTSRGTGRCLILCAMAFMAFLQAAEIAQTTRYGVVELSFSGPWQTPSDNPNLDVDFWVRFRHESGSPVYKIHGFWDGDGKGGTSGNVFKVRFCPTKTGKWYLDEVYSNRSELKGEKQGDYIQVGASSHPGFWEVDGNSAGGRWFKRSNGDHPYIVGNTHYNFLFRPNGHQATPSTIRSDIQMNAKYFRKLRFFVRGPRPENVDPNLKPFFDSSGKQTNKENDRTNPKFFRERVDAAVDEGYKQDLICDLILGGDGDQVIDKTGFIKYMAARYGSYPNVWFCVGQEWNEQASASHEVTMAAKLRSYLAYRVPMSTHGTRGWTSSLNSSDWTHSIRQGKIGDLSDAADALIKDYNNNGHKPTVNDENGYDPKEATTDDVIEGITGSFFGGGYGTTGHKIGSKKGGYFWGHAALGHNITEHPSIDELKYLREKIEQHISFWKMTPVKPGNSIFSNANSGFRVLAWNGNEYALGSDAAQSSVKANLPAGIWEVYQWDIRNKKEIFHHTGISGSYTFSTPASRAAIT